ncbi:MAG: DUF6298 domain-containing protein [Planctomycetota bacterium]|jgi:hypothetical protein
MNRREFLHHSTQAAVGASLALSSVDRGEAAGRGTTTRRTPRSPATGPLKVHPENPRYFADAAGRPVYLTGSHTWNNLVDIGPGDPPPAFDYDAYLDFLVRLGHNYTRMWTWEPVTWNTKRNRRDAVHTAAPQPFARTGPGKALDGKPKFDLAKFDPEYFNRLRSRVTAAGRQGIYVSVMLFEGWAMQFSEGAWQAHPFHPKNNTGGIDGDANGDGAGLDVYTLADRKVTALQEAYLEKVVDTVNDLDNVLYEVTNENHPPSTAWQYHVIKYVKRYEKTKPKQHPAGMTFQYKGGSNRALFDSPADWISPNHEGGYRDNPPAADGKKVILSDTDHLWGIGGNQAWVWKSFLRGMNPIFMDPYDGLVLGKRSGSRFARAWDTPWGWPSGSTSPPPRRKTSWSPAGIAWPRPRQKGGSIWYTFPKGAKYRSTCRPRLAQSP